MEQYEHNVADHEDPLPGPTWLVGFIGVVLLNVVFLGVAALYYGAEVEGDQDKLMEIEPAELEALRAAQEARLSGPARMVKEMAAGALVDQRIVIPIDDAMARIASEGGGVR
jgi:hypothetical protein